MTENKIVQYDGPMPSDEQLANTVTADVAGASNNENVHKNGGFYCFRRRDG